MVDEKLRHAIASSELPVGLIDLDSLAMLALSPRAAVMLGATGDELVGSSVLEVTHEPDATRDALQVMARATIDAYEAHRRIRRPDGSTSHARLWVRDLAAQGHPGLALLFVVPDNDARHEPECARIAPGQPDVTVGTADEHGAVDRLSTEVRDLLGCTNAELEGAALIDSVHPADAERFRDAVALSLDDRCGVGVTVRLANQEHGWDAARMVLSPSDGTPSGRLGFSIIDDVQTLAPSADPAPRDSTSMAELERGLARIANEIQALRVAVGVADLPAGDIVPELADLSSRQWEIVTRLLAGQRPPAIAEAMYLSQSTVRNHLSAVFRKLGVHSQQELIDRLQTQQTNRPPAGDGPSI